MFRPGRDYPQFRPGGMVPAAPPPMNTPMNTPMNMTPPFVPSPMPGRAFVMPHVSGGLLAYPPPPPTPVPPPHPSPFLPSVHAPPFVPPLPHSPPVDIPPPPSPSPPLAFTTAEPTATVKLVPLQPHPQPSAQQAPQQPSMPSDLEILKNIEGMAEFVVNNGPRYESMVRAKHAGDPKFAFLFETDSGPEAVINHEFYKWKKQELQLQSQVEAEAKLSKHLDQEIDARQNQQASHMPGQAEEVPVSPAMSDMDMEDDLAMPSPKRESVGLSTGSGPEPFSPERALHSGKVDKISQRKIVDPSDMPQSLMVSEGLAKEFMEPHGKAHVMNRGKRAQCRLTGDYTGSLIDNYSTDTSDASEDSEPSENVGMNGISLSDQQQWRKGLVVPDQMGSVPQLNSNAEDTTDIEAVSEHAVAKIYQQGGPRSVQLLHPANESPPQTARSWRREEDASVEHGIRFSDVSDSRAFERQGSVGRTGERDSDIGRSVQQRDLQGARLLQKEAPESTFEEIGYHQSRKRSRSHSRSRSRSRNRSGSRSRSRSMSRSRSGSGSRSRCRSSSRSKSRSRSRSQSLEDLSRKRQSVSHSPLRMERWSGSQSKCRSSSRTPPRDLPDRPEKGDGELQEKGGMRVKSKGPNICLNYARGRCFRGNSCRFHHQDGVNADKDLDEADTIQELAVCKPDIGTERGELSEAEEPEMIGPSKVAASSQNFEGNFAVEVVCNAGTSADVGVVRKAKMSSEIEKAEASSEEDLAKRVEVSSETAVVLPQEEKLRSLLSPTPGPPGQASSEGLSLPQEDKSALPHLPPSGPLHPESAHSSQVTRPSLLPLQSKSTGQFVGNSSLMSQPYMFSSQPYPTESRAFGFHQPNSSQLPASPGDLPPYSKPTSFRPPISNTYMNIGNHGDRSSGLAFPAGNQGQVQPQGLVTGEKSKPHQHYPHGSLGAIQSAFRPGTLMQELPDLSQKIVPPHLSSYVSFQAQSGLPQNLVTPHQSVFPPQLLGLPSNSSVTQQHDLLTDSTKALPSMQHGFSSHFSLPAQPHQSLYLPSFPGDTPRHFTFSNVTNNAPQDVYPKPSHSVSAQVLQNSTTWSMPGSLGTSSLQSSALPATGNSSSYSYALTTIPPLPSIIELPGATKLSTSGDQYDPLSDSFEPALTGGLKSTSYSFLKTVEDGKSLGGPPNTIASRLENVSPGHDMEKAVAANMNEAAGDPVVGIVENVSPPEDNRNWSPGQPVEAAEAGQGKELSKTKKSNGRGLKLLRSAVADHVKEVLKPTWREGHMSKDAFKNIVKKAVDKVTATLPNHHIPKSQEKVDQFMSSSRSKISKLVQGYIDKYQKA